MVFWGLRLLVYKHAEPLTHNPLPVRTFQCGGDIIGASLPLSFGSAWVGTSSASAGEVLLFFFMGVGAICAPLEKKFSGVVHGEGAAYLSC